MPEETVYQITKAFWENIDSITSDAPWAKAISLDHAVKQIGTIELHPGARRYYRRDRRALRLPRLRPVHRGAKTLKSDMRRAFAIAENLFRPGRTLGRLTARNRQFHFK